MQMSIVRAIREVARRFPSTYRTEMYPRPLVTRDRARFRLYSPTHALLAQLDRAFASGAKGRGFEPHREHHLICIGPCHGAFFMRQGHAEGFEPGRGRAEGTRERFPASRPRPQGAEGHTDPRSGCVDTPQRAPSDLHGPLPWGLFHVEGCNRLAAPRSVKTSVDACSTISQLAKTLTKGDTQGGSDDRSRQGHSNTGAG